MSSAPACPRTVDRFVTDAAAMSAIELPAQCTARLTRGGGLAVTWRDTTGRHRSVDIAVMSPAIRTQAAARRWAFEELRRAGWGALDQWSTDDQGAHVRPVIRRSPL